MKATRFFRNLNRLNSILLSVVSLLVIAAFGYLLSTVINFRRPTQNQVVKMDIDTAEKPAEKEKADPPSLSSFRAVSGITHPIMKAELQFKSRAARNSYGKGSSSTTQNYLFMNTDTLQSYWLFPDNKQIIVDSDVLEEKRLNPDTNRYSSSAVAVFYQVIDSDTDGDKNLSSRDTMSIAYSRPDGKEYTTVIRDVEKILGAKIMDEYTRHIVIYQKGGRWHTAVISLSTFEIEKEAAVVNPPRG